MKIKIITLIAVIVCAAWQTVLADLRDVRIGVEQDGMYYVSASEIAYVLGVPDQDVWTNIAVGNIKLKNCGTQVVYKVASPQHGFFFYGTKGTGNYTEENAYMLTWSAGTQMASIPGTPPVSGGMITFAESRHFRGNEFTAMGYFTNPDEDYWFWNYFIPDSFGDESGAFPFEVNGVVTSATARITISLFGATASGVSPEHHATAKLNGTSIGELLWAGIGATTLVADVSGNLLLEGTNTLEITSLLDGGVPYSIFYLKSFDVDYQRKNEALNDRLAIQGFTSTNINISGFSTSDVRVVNISNPQLPVLLAGVGVELTNASYSARFYASDTDAVYIAYSENACLMASDISAVNHALLKTTNNTAEYVIITADELSSASTNLANYRATKNISTMIVLLKDIYNEFNDGIADPQAIKDFIVYASSNWVQPPRYIVLAGQGTFDYKDKKNYGDCIIPAMLVKTPDGMFESDGWFTDMNNDMVPEIAIGRLPAATDAELQVMVDRIIAYENSPTEAWLDNALLLADVNDEGGKFNKSSDKISAKLPANINKNKIYLSGSNTQESRISLIDAINNGAFIMNYFGHSGTWTLSREGLLTVDDIPLLTNANRPVIVTSMSCQMGRFAVPGFDCLAEDLVLSQSGGAVAVIAPSGMSYNNSAEKICAEFYSQVFGGECRIIGDALLTALTEFSKAGKENYMASMYNLMGDPGLMLRGVSHPTDDPYALMISAMETWKAASFTSSELDDPAISGDYADPDGDQIPNILEYALGTDPKIMDDPSVISALSEKPDIGMPYDAIVKFKRDKNKSGVDYGLTVATNLISGWSDGAGNIVHTTTIDDGNGKTETVKYFVKSPAGEQQFFIRLRLKKSHTK